MTSEVSEKPPYTASNPDERKDMIEWVCQKLREDEQKLFTPLINALSDPNYTSSKEFAIQQAWYGNIKPLQNLFPELVPFLGPSEPRDQKKDLSRWLADKWMAIDWVAFDVLRVRAIWKKFYPDKRQRRETDGASAYDIAVIYFEHHPMGARGRTSPTLDEVEARLKPSGPSGKKPPKKASPRTKKRAVNRDSKLKLV